MTTPIVALQPLQTAIVKTPGNRALPGSLKAGSNLGKGAFQALFAKNLDLTGDAGLLSRITSLLQQGVPMATITNGIAAKLSGALARAAGEPADARARSTLQRALSKALAPPGSGPPQGTPEQQAAALEQRVKDLLAKLTGAAPKVPAKVPDAGQKSEFSGSILDAAKTAKDIPAPQKSTTSPVEFSTDDIAALTHSLLQAAAAAQGVPPAQAPAAKAPPAASAATVAALQKPPAPNPTASGDLLTRMVARAVNAAGEHTDTGAKQAQMPSSGPGSQPAAAAVFARLIAAAGQNPGSQTGGHGGDWQTPEQPKDAPVQSAPRSSGDPLPVSAQNAAPAFSGHIAAAQTQTSGSALSYSTVDPNAVVEQVLKGITIRKDGETSEIRLHLQPDSLGDVSLKLTVNGNSIAANVVAQNAHVRDILLANQQQLARSLADAGLSLGNFSVDVSGGNAGFTGSGSEQQQQRFMGSRPGAFGAVLAAEDDSWGDNRFGPPVFGGSKALVLNYLA